MRWEVVNQFQRNISKNSKTFSNVAIIGGSTKDAEIKILKELNPSAKFTVFGIENENNDSSFEFLDMNTKYDINTKRNFDLILCSQVLEHVWNHETFFTNILLLSSLGTKIWISCPASNMVHGSPDYFSAGFTSDYLSLNLKKIGINILNQGELGSKRFYIATHLNREWLSEKEHSHPIKSYEWKKGSLLGKINRYRKLLPGRIFQKFQSSKISGNLDYATESWIYAVNET